jgi:hypothetical protein
MEPTPNIHHVAGTTTQPIYSVQEPGQVKHLLGFNIMVVDVILANRFATSTLTGSEGVPVYPPLWEKQGIVNFPANGLVFDTPIYRDFGSSLSTTGGTTGGNTGGNNNRDECLVGWTMVTIKHADGFEKEVPISEVRIGDQIKTMDRNTCLHGWATVTGAESHKVNEVFEVATPKKSIMVTGSHPIATFSEATKELWTKVYDLETGAWVITEDALEMVVAKIRLEGQYTVYDLTVPGPNAFVANGILVHNMKKL